jgi:hypothetical protein
MWEVRRDRFVVTERRILATSRSSSFDEPVGPDGYAKIPAIAPDFHNESRSFARSTWINVVQPGADFTVDDTALLFPSNLWKPGFPRLTSERLTITREGWVSALSHSIGYSLLRLMKGREAIIEWFKTLGLTAHPSEAGQVAAQIIAAVGGLSSCAMFADKDTVILLNSRRSF